MRKSYLDVLINNAGIYGNKKHYDFGELDYDIWMKTLYVNTLAPVKLAEVFLPNLIRSKYRLIVSISSLMGSMSDNMKGGSILYRSSKAGLNAAMKSLAIDLYPKKIGVLILHPGWVKTDMTNEKAPILPEESIMGMRKVIEEFNMEKSGYFLNFKGEQQPW